jgi:hypothetical protein
MPEAYLPLMSQMVRHGEDRDLPGSSEKPIFMAIGKQIRRHRQIFLPV